MDHDEKTQELIEMPIATVACTEETVAIPHPIPSVLPIYRSESSDENCALELSAPAQPPSQLVEAAKGRPLEEILLVASDVEPTHVSLTGRKLVIHAVPTRRIRPRPYLMPRTARMNNTFRFPTPQSMLPYNVPPPPPLPLQNNLDDLVRYSISIPDEEDAFIEALKAEFAKDAFLSSVPSQVLQPHSNAN